jgi:Rps23 Pro-64 3,4-dihydroxylase Tpa1-like proline 4-hydroxylase
MTAQEILANLSGTLMDDERILSVRERELLTSLLQHTRTHSGARDNAVTESIARAVGEVIAQRAYGILGSNIAQRLLDESLIPSHGNDVNGIRAHSPHPPAPSPPGPGPKPDDAASPRPTGPRPGPRGYEAAGPRGAQDDIGGMQAHSPHPPAPSPPGPGPKPDEGGSPLPSGPRPSPRGYEAVGPRGVQNDLGGMRAHSPHPPAPSPPGPGPKPDDAKSPRPTGPGSGPRGYEAEGPRAVQSDSASVAVLEMPQQLRGECVVLDEFLAPAELEELMAYTLACEDQFQLSEIISPEAGGSVDFEYRRSRALLDLDKHRDVIVSRIHSAMPEILGKLGHEPFETTRVEAQITASNDGDFFRWHNDNGHGEIATRELTFVYFFHREPKQFQGGELRLYDSQWQDGMYRPQEKYRTIVPQQNQAVFFLSSLAHEITPVECPSGAFADSRFTVNGWFHR